MEYKSIEAFIGATMAQDPAMEGVNIQVAGMYIKYLITNTGLMNKMHDAEKHGDYARAADYARNIAGNIAQIEQNISNLPQSGGSAVILEITALVLCSCALVAGYFGAVHGSIKASDAILKAHRNHKAWTKSPIVKYIFKILPQRIGGQDALKCFGWGMVGMGATSGIFTSIIEKSGFFIDTKGMSDADIENLPSNDLNMLIAAVRKDLQKTKDIVMKVASECEYKASLGAEEANEGMFTYDELTGIEVALESFMDTIAMEGTNIDAINLYRQRLKEVRAMKSEMREAADSGQYAQAAKIAADIAKRFDEYNAMLNDLKASKASAAIIDIALMLITLVAAGATAYAVIKSKPVQKRIQKTTEGLNKQKWTEMLDPQRVADAEKIANDQITKKYGQLTGEMAAQQVKDAVAKYGAGAPEVATLREKLVKQLWDQRNSPKIPEGEFARLKEAAYNTAAKGIAEKYGASIKTATGAIKRKAAGAGALVGSTVAGGFLAKLGILHHGDRANRALNANDFNALINALRKDCARGKKTFMQLSYEYNERAKMAGIAV